MHIFISHVPNDTHALALELQADFHTLGDDLGLEFQGDFHQVSKITCSLSTEKLWGNAIHAEIDRADLIIVLISPAVNWDMTSGQSESFILNEIRYALGQAKPILTVLAQSTAIPSQRATIESKQTNFSEARK